MKAEAITLLFNEVSDVFPPIDSKATDDNLLAIQEKFLPILMLISYDQLTAVHSITGIITNNVWYMAEHGNVARNLHVYHSRILQSPMMLKQ